MNSKENTGLNERARIVVVRTFPNIPPKRLFIINPHGVTFQKTAFLVLFSSKYISF
jgi:hypothetical protein